jgi:hypothetical protein
MSNNEDIAQIEVERAIAQNHIDMHEALKRLGKNKDWKLLIEEFYLKENAARLVGLRGRNGTPEQLEKTLKEIDAIGMFNNFLQEVVGAGEHFAYAVAQGEATIEEIYEEGV